MTLPPGSVMETIVLLNVLLMWACPCAMFLRSLRRTFLAPAVRLLGGILLLNLGGHRSTGDAGPALRTRHRDYFLPAFFLPATVFFLPLRVRALVCVR